MQFSSSKMDELLIAEVQKHEVIYNRQKYFLINNTGPEKYGSKDDAWNIIAITLGSDIDTCKKRWKYLRERYVQQRKHGDTPTYEHLSRPYLEKMKFLDQHIQPRKSYRNVSQFLPSPNANAPFGELQDSSRSNGSTRNAPFVNYQEGMLDFKAEPEPFQHFSPINHSQTQNPQTPTPSHYTRQQQQQPQQQQHSPTVQPPVSSNNGKYQLPPQNDYRENDVYNIPSTSSSLRSPSTPDHHNEGNSSSKKPRLEYQTNSNSISSNKNNNNNNNKYNNNNNNNNNKNNSRNSNNRNNNSSSNLKVISSDEELDEEPQNSHVNNEVRYPRTQTVPNDIFYSLFQQYATPPQRHLRTSEHLLGELVTAELIKMSKERRKVVQKKILQILFFED